MRKLGNDHVIVEPVAGEVPRMRLMIGGNEAVVNGRSLRDACVMGPEDPIEGYIFFTDDDSPFEEALSITLTDSRLAVLDQATIGAPYATALLDDVRVEGPGRLAFNLASDTDTWRLTVLDRPEWRVPLLSGKGWQWHGLALRRNFRIERDSADG